MNVHADLIEQSPFRGGTPAPVCPDYDEECADVTNPFACWNCCGTTETARGYCPEWFRNSAIAHGKALAALTGGE